MSLIKPIASSFLILFFSGWFLSCSKSEPTFKTSGFNSPDEMLKNPMILNALANTKVRIYAGLNPPDIQGEYSTANCYYSSVSSNLNIGKTIGQYLNSHIKFSDEQTDHGLIHQTEADNSLSFNSDGASSFIAGGDSLFTVYSENHNSDGSTNVSIMSGSITNKDTIQILSVSVVTANPPPDINVGDWFGVTGILVH